jgi:hypothetical protein
MTIQNHLKNSGVVAENAKNSNIVEISKILATAICRLHNKNLHQIEQKELDSNSLASVHRPSINLNLQGL